MTNLIGVNELLLYKTQYSDIHPNLKSYITNISIRHKKSKYRKNNWKRMDPKNNNWLLLNRFNQDKNQKIIGNMRIYLNQLNEKNYEVTKNKIINLEITSEYLWISFIDILFIKAITEQTYNKLYTKICKELISRYIIDKDNNKIYFRIIFLNKCQDMFKKVISIKCEKDIENSEFVYKYKLYGFMTFLGELYNSNILISRVIRSCLKLLIINTSPELPHLIKCLCNLMSTIGKKIFKKDQKIAQENFDEIVKFSKIFPRAPKIKTHKFL